jgi:hypothetical protein
MIDCKLIDVTEEQEIQLRTLLNSGGFGTLIKVLESQVKLHQTNALKDAAKANEHENFALSSNENMKLAQKYNTAVTVLNELKSRKEINKIAKMS